MTSSARQQSGALSWQDVSDWGNKALDTVQEYTPMIKDAAEIYGKVSGKERRDELLYVDLCPRVF